MGKGIGGFVSGMFGRRMRAKSQGPAGQLEQLQLRRLGTGAEDRRRRSRSRARACRTGRQRRRDVVNIDYSQAQRRP